MGKWTWALLFVGSILLALYFFKYKKPGDDAVVPGQSPAIQAPPQTNPEDPPPTAPMGNTSPLSGEIQPQQGTQPPPPPPPPPPQTPPNNYFEPPPQYEPPPPPPPPPQYPEPIEPFNANPGFEQPPPDNPFPDDVPPPPPPQAFPDEDFD